MITHVAIRSNGIVYSLPAPHRHHHILWILSKRRGNEGAPDVADEHLLTQTPDAGMDSQGFLDDGCKYLTRKEAEPVAMLSGQIKNGKITRQCTDVTYNAITTDFWANLDLIGSQENNVHLTSVRGVALSGNVLYSGH